MVFFGLTLCLIALIAGIVFTVKGSYAIGIGLILVGIVIFFLVRSYCRKNQRKRKGDGSTANSLIPDCGLAAIPDCPELPDCPDLPDCTPDCSH